MGFLGILPTAASGCDVDDSPVLPPFSQSSLFTIAVFLRRRIKSQIAPTMIARPTITPTATPALLPSLSPELPELPIEQAYALPNTPFDFKLSKSEQEKPPELWIVVCPWTFSRFEKEILIG